jgi:hypothetical protein
MADTYNIGPTVPGLFRAHEDRYQEAQAEIERLRELLAEAADDLTDLINAEHPPDRRAYPSNQRRYESDMEVVIKIRAALAKEDK